ncbi:MAG: putative DNA binding domain-containing protein [Candidatus Margulisbacteria bacterium]|nr:putative DNA binding domain-containing protein [Candidatus Margulisiibacteriota bacterium]
MTWDDILVLLEQGEGQSVEFEKNIPSDDDLARELVAFSNADGGKIIYGLDDKNKHLVGVDAAENFEERVKKIAKNHCVPLIEPAVDIVDKAGKKLVIINVPEGVDKPFRSDDICYIRDGKASRPAKENEVKEITNPWSGKGLNKRQIRALQMVAEHSSITNREFRDAFNVSHKTAHIELTLLADKKLLQTEGAGRSTCYIMPQQKLEGF